MRVRFTPSARVQLLESLVRLRDSDRDAALGFLHRAARALRELASGEESGAEMPSRRGLPYLSEHHRFLYRVKGKTVWVLAVWDSGAGPRVEGVG